MDKAKPWYQSEAIWGGAAAFIAGISGMFGFELVAADVNSVLMSAMATVGGIMAIVGRFKASSKIK